MKLLVSWLVVAAARKAPKKFESAKEMTLDAPAIEASKDQLFCVAPPDAPAASLTARLFTQDEVDAPMRRRVAPAQRL